MTFMPMRSPFISMTDAAERQFSEAIAQKLHSIRMSFTGKTTGLGKCRCARQIGRNSKLALKMLNDRAKFFHIAVLHFFLYCKN